MPRDYYEVLGVPRDADESTIKKSFRRLARELHPDVNAHDPEAEEKFKEAAEAYEVLSDPDRRRTYDAYGHDAGNDPDRARDVVGHAVYCPEGGRYDFDPREGGAYCTLHGRPGRARQAIASSGGSDERALHGVRDVELGFALTEQGIRVKLRLVR